MLVCLLVGSNQSLLLFAASGLYHVCTKDSRYNTTSYYFCRIGYSVEEWHQSERVSERLPYLCVCVCLPNVGPPRQTHTHTLKLKQHPHVLKVTHSRIGCCSQPPFFESKVRFWLPLVGRSGLGNLGTCQFWQGAGRGEKPT